MKPTSKSKIMSEKENWKALKCQSEWKAMFKSMVTRNAYDLNLG